MNNVVRYWVYYGSWTSRQPCVSLKDVNAFVAHCLRENTPINSITKAAPRTVLA